MHADLTRDTFDAAKHFSRVLIQQGRVPLDADLNEQASILLHYQRRLAADLIGAHGGPTGAVGFKITPHDGTLTIGQGRYYVDGILVECEGDTDYFAQPDLRLDPQHDALPAAPYVVALHVWERHKSAAEDEAILEPALGGPDTASRAQVVWQVRAHPAAELAPDDPNGLACDDVVPALAGGASGRMRARIREETPDTDPCVLSPGSRFRGLENQLYRVEIHRGGAIGADDAPVAGAARPTFKWSRENGSVVLPLRTLHAERARVETLGRDRRLGVHEGDWVEVLDDDRVLRGGEPAPLASVQRVDRDALTLDLEAAALPSYDEKDAGRHPLLRRWDQQDPARVSDDAGPEPDEKDVALVDGAVPVSTWWTELELGIQVQFEAGSYRAGDYWLIPARTAIGDIQWPTEKGPDGEDVASWKWPRGTERHYAPLAIVRAGGPEECRRCFDPISKPCGP